MQRRRLLESVVFGLAAGLPPRARGQNAEAYAQAIAKARTLDQLHALVVVQDGEVVVAQAFRGPAPDVPVNVKSVSKTIVALLTGIAINQGALSGTDARLGDLIADLIPPGAQPRVQDITVADLLTMQAGLQRTSGPYYGDWVASSNWVANALGRPFVAEPGAQFLYSTGSFHVLGAVLSRATGRSLHDLAQSWLGAPLGIAIPPWTRDPQGFYLGGNNMALSPLGMARIGETVRQGGRWQGQQVIPAGWIETSWQPRTRSPFSGDFYGYGWFLRHLGGAPTAYARGYGGQMLYVIPEHALTVAITSDPTRPARTHGHVGDLNRLVSDSIILAS